MKATHTLLLIMNGRCCKAYLNDGPQRGLMAVAEADRQSHFDPDHDERSDRPGRSFDSVGAGRHAMEPPTPTDELARRRFALEVAQWMEHAACVATADRLILAAPPAVLGVLRTSLSQRIAEKIVHQADKDYTQASVEELIEHLLPLAA